MTRYIRIAIAAAVVGAATGSLAGSPDGVRAISPSVPLQGMTETTASPSRTDVRVAPYALGGTPPATSEPAEWRWVPQNYGNVHGAIPER